MNNRTDRGYKAKNAALALPVVNVKQDIRDCCHRSISSAAAAGRSTDRAEIERETAELPMLPGVSKGLPPPLPSSKLVSSLRSPVLVFDGEVGEGVMTTAAVVLVVAVLDTTVVACGVGFGRLCVVGVVDDGNSVSVSVLLLEESTSSDFVW